MIVDTATLPLVGLLLLRAAGPRQIDPVEEDAAQEADPNALEPVENSIRQPSAQPSPEAPGPAVPLPAKLQALPQGLDLAWIGAIALVLLAIWQLPLGVAALDRIDQTVNRNDRELLARRARSEEQLRQADRNQILSNWQQLEASQPPGLRQNQATPEDRRQQLQMRLRTNVDQALLRNRSWGMEARRSLGRERLRVLLLSLIYSWALVGLSRRPET